MTLNACLPLEERSTSKHQTRQRLIFQQEASSFGYRSLSIRFTSKQLRCQPAVTLAYSIPRCSLQVHIDHEHRLVSCKFRSIFERDAENPISTAHNPAMRLYILSITARSGSRHDSISSNGSIDRYTFDRNYDTLTNSIFTKVYDVNLLVRIK